MKMHGRCFRVSSQSTTRRPKAPQRTIGAGGQAHNRDTKDFHRAIGINRPVSESVLRRIRCREYCRKARSSAFDRVSDNVIKELLFMAMFLTIKAGAVVT